jgi:hypothetical protein
MQTLETDSLILRLDFPNTKEIYDQLCDFLALLHSPQDLRSSTIAWTTNTMKHLRLERIHRSTGDYYRDPHILLLTLHYPTLGESSYISVKLDYETSLRLGTLFERIKRQIYTILSVSNKWKGPEDLSIKSF